MEKNEILKIRQYDYVKTTFLVNCRTTPSTPTTSSLLKGSSLSYPPVCTKSHITLKMWSGVETIDAHSCRVRFVLLFVTGMSLYRFWSTSPTMILLLCQQISELVNNHQMLLESAINRKNYFSCWFLLLLWLLPVFKTINFKFNQLISHCKTWHLTHTHLTFPLHESYQ